MNLIREYILNRKVFFNLLIFLLWGKMLLDYMRGIVGLLPVIGDYQAESEIVVVVSILLLALPSMLNRLTPFDWMIMVGSLAVYLLQFILYPCNEDILMEFMYPTLCLVIPFFFFGRVLDVQAFLKPMTVISVTCVLMDALYFLIYMRNPAQMAERMAGDYYMFQAYRLLPHIMFIAWRCMKDFSVWKLFLSLLGILLIFAYGTRGPLACLGAFYIICFFVFTKFKYSFWFKSATIALCGIGALFLQPILLALKEMLTELDMSTRIVERMLAGGLTHDTGRGYIKVEMYELLERPDTFWGYGLFGSKRFDIVYPHDYKLDFFFNYGYFIGGLLLLFTSYIIVKAMVVARTSIEREFIVLLVCSTIIRYHLSFTYIEDGMYFALLGYCTTILFNNRYAHESYNSHKHYSSTTNENM